LETFGQNHVRGQETRAQLRGRQAFDELSRAETRAQHAFRAQHTLSVERSPLDPELVELLATSIHADHPSRLQIPGFCLSKKLRDQGLWIG
jgi:hypothetical protein